MNRLIDANKKLSKEIEDLHLQIGSLAAMVEKLKHPLTTREAMRALEKYICVDIVGSKKQAKNKRIYTVDLAAASTLYSPALYKILTQDQIDLINYLKTEGDTAYSTFNKTQLEEALNDKDDDQQEVQDKAYLVSLLETYCKNGNKAFGESPW
jgi:hypothetical protein